MTFEGRELGVGSLCILLVFFLAPVSIFFSGRQCLNGVLFRLSVVEYNEFHAPPSTETRPGHDRPYGFSTDRDLVLGGVTGIYVASAGRLASCHDSLAKWFGLRRALRLDVPAVYPFFSHWKPQVSHGTHRPPIRRTPRPPLPIIPPIPPRPPPRAGPPPPAPGCSFLGFLMVSSTARI